MHVKWQAKPLKHCGAVVIITAQIHSTKLELRFCTGFNPATSMSEIPNGEDLWQWFLNILHSSIPPFPIILMFKKTWFALSLNRPWCFAPILLFIKNFMKWTTKQFFLYSKTLWNRQNFILSVKINSAKYAGLLLNKKLLHSRIILSNNVYSL